jgi:tRNA nucleotidyltransferase (CCA-adding enzyme)
VASARREEYAAPGALPEVITPASIADDLSRRDFTVNAMAVSLSPGTFGGLLDPAAGSRDLRSRRIRLLHPLSFVEDPTRIFRAVRYAVRLDFVLDRETRRLLKAALRIGAYPALSGQRLLAEIDLIVAEARAPRILITLGRLGAFRLLDASYRFSPLAVGRLAELSDLFSRCEEGGITVLTRSLTLLALTERLPDHEADRIFHRLSLSGGPLRQLLSARRDGPVLAEAAASLNPGSPSRWAALFRGHTAETIGWAWCLGRDPARRGIEWFLAKGRGLRPLLSGDDLLSLGIPEGPPVGALLDRLRDARLDGTVATRDDEAALVRAWSESRETQTAPMPDARGAEASRPT